jgi:hypothetical protein
VKTINLVIWSFIQCILTFLLFTIYVANSHYSGGEIGMTPLAVALVSLIQLTIIIPCSYFFRYYFAGNRLIFLFIINIVVYQLAFIGVSRGIPIMGIFESGLRGFLNIGYTLSSLISGIGIIIIFWLIRQYRSKKIENKLNSYF